MEVLLAAVALGFLFVIATCFIILAVALLGFIGGERG